MKTKTFAVIFIALIFALSLAAPAFSDHKDEKKPAKGVITKIEIAEIEVTVKDEKGVEKKVKTSDATLKLGDRVVIKNGKVTLEVKPISGGY